MEENFKEIVELIKKSTMDPNETKKYILSIKKIIKKAVKNCKDEQEERLIIQEYIEDYMKDLEFRGNAQKIFPKMLQYTAIKKVQGNYKGNRATFDSVMKEARRRENTNKTESITVKLESKESMVSMVRYLMRKYQTTNERWIVDHCLPEEKRKISKELKTEMIKIIQHSVSVLEEHGVIDQYIQTSNKELEQLGLSELKYIKRNPIADEQYEQDELVENEDIGVIDTFSSEYLNNMTVEDLEIMTVFWESKYLQERLELSKAMSTIKTLNLWDAILDDNDEKIENLDEEEICNALKKDLALTYLCKKDVKITPKMKRQYKKFLKQNNIDSNTQLEDDVKEVFPEISNLNATAKDIAIFEGLIMHQLKTKDIKVKRWGTIEEEIEPNEQNGVVLAIENQNFRGPLIMEVPENILTEFFGEDRGKFPKYEKELDEKYCDIMSRLYLPANNFFNTYIRNKYEENPKSKLLADLSGKKVREERE